MRLLTWEDRSEWLNIWERTGREPHGHPDYVKLFGAGDTSVALYWRDGATHVLLPLSLRSVPEELTEGAGLLATYDAVSPYGYGGPYASDATLDIDNFYREVLSWMQNQGWASCFVRSSLDKPPPRDIGDDRYAAVHLNDNIEVDLLRSAEEQWSHYAHKVRKNVKKARRNNLTFQVWNDNAPLADFYEVYRTTMRRREAAAWYHFDQAFFEDFARCMNGAFLTAAVIDDLSGSWVSGEIVLQSDRALYSFLGGTTTDGLMVGANDLLKHGVIEVGAGRGLSRYVLGGGPEPGDGIYRYKRGFDQDGVKPFFGVQLIGDLDIYRRLVQAAGRGVCSTDTNRAGYFPLYR